MANKIKELELKRKVMHVLVGITGLFILIYTPITPFIIFMILVIGVLVSFLSLKVKIPVIWFFLNNFERDEDLKKLPGRGIIFAVVGSLLALKLFPEDIALASIAILTFADPISYLVGKLGNTKSFIDNRKNIEGNIAGFLISSLIAMFFVHPVLALSGALAAMLFESLIIEVQRMEIDDNLVIPLAAGTTMLLIKMFVMRVV